MQKTEYFCDRCGKQVGSAIDLVRIGVPFGLVEICENCNEKFINIQANFLGGYEFPTALTKVQPSLNGVSLDPCDTPTKVSYGWHEEQGAVGCQKV